MKKPELSVIVVGWNSKKFLDACFRSIFASKFPQGKMQVIFVDNGSTDGSASFVRRKFPRVQIVATGKNLGMGGGNNHGAKIATGDFLALVNPDIEVSHFDRDAFGKMVRTLRRNSKVGIVGPQLIFPSGEVQLSCRKFMTLGDVFLRRTFLAWFRPIEKRIRTKWMLDFDHATPRTVDWLVGACLIVRRNEFLKIGGFDEKYFLLVEDTDLAMAYRRILRKGSLYFPEAKILHNHRRLTNTGFFRPLLQPLAWRHARNLIRFAWKWRK